VHGRTSASVELLVPDFDGDENALRVVLQAEPEVLGHNVEVVPRLYPRIRSRADYARSLQLLRRVKELCPSTCSKSGLMVGVGEEEREVIGVMHDLQAVGCDLLTIGQYLRPSPEHYPVVEYVTPQTFDRYSELALDLGFRGARCGPFVRSSYCARELFENAKCADP
jgi:lipoic acid synthetase